MQYFTDFQTGDVIVFWYFDSDSEKRPLPIWSATLAEQEESWSPR